MLHACSYVNHHWRSHTGIKLHHFNECEKAFKETSLFSIRFFLCRKPMNVINVCVWGWRFSYISILIQHLRSHTLEKSFECRNLSLFHHQNVYYTRAESDMQMEKFTSIFQAFFNIKILERKLLIICM